MTIDSSLAHQTSTEHGPPPGLASPDALVTLTNATVAYDGAPALSDVTLTIRRGDLIGIVGPSGAGKTTLLRAILRQVDLIGGRITLHAPRPGKSVRVGYVPQVETVDWSFPITVEQTVLLGRWREVGWRPWPSKRDRQLVHDALERLGIAQVATRPIRALSGGQQQRVFLARALIGEPDLLLLDEPTSGVDIQTRHEMMHLLGELNRAGTSIVLTTHDLNSVATHLPRLVCIGKGQVIGDGSPGDVLTAETLRTTYGAAMLVLRHGESVYVVDHPDAALQLGSASLSVPDTDSHSHV